MIAIRHAAGKGLFCPVLSCQPGVFNCRSTGFRVQLNMADSVGVSFFRIHHEVNRRNRSM
jgi:hypothetical protein